VLKHYNTWAQRMKEGLRRGLGISEFKGTKADHRNQNGEWTTDKCSKIFVGGEGRKNYYKRETRELPESRSQARARRRQV